ncbi:MULTISPECIES: hypothetical protein [unclassified Actinopolyspora]|uniref:hypothetical protein n=1 Tax=unclassified Actinopolyspora TaxID=2639451 RepID=UPI0013F66F90|nr:MULTISPECIES: hypothetical protein [unclassified Actinopolyspora]NHD18157.1 hypothetical protein [Actinopolyspora sp. BKK2]NHE77166.1 hypothetical protein [Actinopolyspora sp. BKK1]
MLGNGQQDGATQLRCRISVRGLWSVDPDGSIGYDMHTGKPPGKTVFSGVAGAGAAALVASTPVGWGALAAVGVGVGVAADFVYDALPQGVQDKINEGVEAVGNTVADGAEAVGDAVSGAWNAVF